MTRVGFPHSDILGSTLGWQLPEAYRSLPRPSSALDAKASTMRPLTLTNTKTKVFIKNCTNKHTTPTRGQRIHSMLATTIQLPNTTPHHQDGATPPTPLTTPASDNQVLSQDPTVCLAILLS